MIGTPCVCGERNTWHKKCYQNQAAELKLLRKQRDDLLAAFNKSISKVESATCCHQNAVRTLLDEAIEIWGASISSVKGDAEK